MKKQVSTEAILENPFDQIQNSNPIKPELYKKYFTFFEYSPVALWIEDFSEAKKYINKLVKEANTDIHSYITNHPEIIKKIASLVIIRDVNSTAVKLYKAKNKAELLNNLSDVFTEESNIGFAKLLRNVLLGELETEVETVNKKLDGVEFDTLIKFKVVEGSEESLENIIVSSQDITETIEAKSIIEKSEKNYRDIFNKSIDAVLILKDGVVVDCNKSTLKMFNHDEKKDLLNTHPSGLSPEIQSSGESSYIKSQRMIKIALEKGSNRFRWDHQRKDGGVFPAEVSLTRIDENDEKPKIHAVVKDITERVKNEALEDVLYNISKAALTINDFKEFSLFLKNELHKLIDTRNFYIALYDDKKNEITTPVFADEKEEKFTLPANKSLTGYVIKTKKSLMVYEEDHKKLIEENEVELIGEFSKIWVGVPLRIEKEVLGVIVVQSYENVHAYNESDMQLLEFVADQISTTIQRKKAENELKKALVKAQESDRLKSSFLANMSHEIRTPMNGIIGFSEFFLDPNLSGEERSKYAEIVINSSKQLLSIVNDILDISKIEAGVVQLNYESINLNKLLDRLNEFYKQKAKENNLELKCVKGLDEDLSVIEIDSLKLNQVLTNLLSNAFKFTNEGNIEFGYQLKDNNLEFYVKDTGVGIEKNLQNKIFDRFIQANLDLNKKLQGTGLGLSISKKFIELFKGKIWIDSNENGSTVYFTIPYTKSAASTIISSKLEEQKPVIEVKNQELTILVAEDEEYNMMYINELFSKTNFKIIEASNGKVAIELVEKHPEINLILMDIKMPVMDGHEAMKEIKMKNPNMPIIALSAFAMESDKKEALKNGFDEYLTKPIDKNILFKVIGSYSFL